MEELNALRSRPFQELERINDNRRRSQSTQFPFAHLSLLCYMLFSVEEIGRFRPLDVFSINSYGDFEAIWDNSAFFFLSVAKLQASMIKEKLYPKFVCSFNLCDSTLCPLVRRAQFTLSGFRFLI